MTGSKSNSDTMDRLDLGVVVAALVRGIPFILVVSLVLAAIVFAYASTRTPIFRAEAILLVEDRENPFARPRGEQPQAGAPEADDSAISSHIQLLQTNQMLQTAAEQFELAQAPEYRAALEPGLTEWVKSLAGLNIPSLSAREREDAVLNELRSNVVVVRQRDSRVISLFVDSEDPELAANLANGIAQEHVRQRAVSQLSLIHI